MITIQKRTSVLACVQMLKSRAVQTIQRLGIPAGSADYVTACSANVVAGKGENECHEAPHSSRKPALDWAEQNALVTVRQIFYRHLRSQPEPQPTDDNPSEKKGFH